MNIPTGERVAENISTAKVDVRKVISDLENKKFSGYISVTNNNGFGFEDGALFFKLGNVIGSVHTFLFYDKSVYGDESAALFFNSFASKSGCFDVFRLTSEQMELIVTFNDKILFKSQNNQKLFDNYVKEYKASLVEKYIDRSSSSKDKYGLLKEIGLGNIGI
ncbi:MAG: hypothetical protein COT55_02595 [Candidatus Diapherotrites archaeon CG09_land_8_20_14_0_10_32_12]|nr:MAG: hypothetical protein COT55_02595 [Candidatus Diapherotrites archaeon CG09_land_8_20_14_0_10_32_12]